MSHSPAPFHPIWQVITPADVCSSLPPSLMDFIKGKGEPVKPEVHPHEHTKKAGGARRRLYRGRAAARRLRR